MSIVPFLMAMMHGGRLAFVQPVKSHHCRATSEAATTNCFGPVFIAWFNQSLHHVTKSRYGCDGMMDTNGSPLKTASEGENDEPQPTLPTCFLVLSTKKACLPAA
ncbi:unnamed protein product [Effrenium voratum]|nr:unnamed protein product [Effrenium voratum]